MPDFAADIGATVHVYVPDDDVAIDNGYTHVRIYWASSQTASASLETSVELVEEQRDYSYNKDDALEGDWWEWALYGATPGEGPRSERTPVGPPRATRQDIRQLAGQRLRVCRVLEVAASPSPTSTAFASSELIDADASTYLHCNKVVRFTTGTLAGEVKRVRDKAATGYTPATGLLTCNAFTGAPTAGDDFELWVPNGSDDTSELMDQAISQAAAYLWWPETFFFSTDEDVEEYFMPFLMRRDFIRSIEFSTGTYPSEPGWQPVARPVFRYQSGRLVLNLQDAGPGLNRFTAGTIVKIEYDRPAQELNTDSEAWYVNRRWAAVEAAMAFLDLIGTPRGGLENIVDAERAKGALQRDIEMYRGQYFPAPTSIPIVVPR